MKTKQISASFVRGTLLVTFIAVFFLPFIILPKLSKSQHAIYALVCAFFCFLAFYVSNKINYKHPDAVNKMLTYSFWCGLGEAVVAVLFWTISNHPPGLLVGLMIMGNYGLSMLGYSSSIFVIFASLFPQIIVKTKSAPQPDVYTDLPNNLRNVIQGGRDSVNLATITAFGILISIVVVSMFFLGQLESPLFIMSIEILAAIIVSLIVRYFAIRKWQQRAMQSGISETKLKSAAKQAGLWWPKIKEK